jgi:hypothetical protein
MFNGRILPHKFHWDLDCKFTYQLPIPNFTKDMLYLGPFHIVFRRARIARFEKYVIAGKRMFKGPAPIIGMDDVVRFKYENLFHPGCLIATGDDSPRAFASLLTVSIAARPSATSKLSPGWRRGSPFM